MTGCWAKIYFDERNVELIKKQFYSAYGFGVIELPVVYQHQFEWIKEKEEC